MRERGGGGEHVEGEVGEFVRGGEFVRVGGFVRVGEFVKVCEFVRVGEHAHLYCFML